MSAIPRYGVRVIPHTEQTIAAVRAAGQIVEGPHIAEFEKAFAAKMGANHAVATSYGRMAFFYLLEAPGAERAAEAIQLPVYASLKPNHIDWIATVVREAVAT